MRWTALAIFLLPLGATTADATEACNEYQLQSFPVAPAPGETDVPLNTRVWLNPAGAGLPSLTDSAGVVIPTTAATAAGLTVLIPVSPLAPSALHHVMWGGVERGSFTTGTTSLLQAPAIPHVIKEEQQTGTYAASIQRYRHTVWTLDTEARLRAFDVHGAATPDGGQGAGNPATVTDATLVSFSKDDSCSIKLGGESADVRVGGFDLAGNFSGWSPARKVDLPAADEPGCGCQAASAGPGPAVLAAVGVVLWMARQRRRSGRM